MTTADDESLHYANLGEVCARIKSGELSSEEVTSRMLERIRSLEPDLHAFAMVLPEQALETARALDRQRENGEPLGLLHGVPVAVKDLLFTKGLATASGTLVMAEFVPDEDATVVERLKRAGAVIIGKTQLTEGAYGVHHPDIEPPRNPWDRRRWSGVSSSGSGVAIAAGLTYGALGSDTGGSIRFPSASCGVVGLKPTYGRVSKHGAFPLAESLDHIGPMARSVGDTARMLQVMAGYDPKDPTCLDAPVPNYLKALDQPLAGLTLGVDWPYVSAGVEAPVIDGVREAVALFEALGARVVDATMPDGCLTLVYGWGRTCSVECARAHAAYYPARRREYGDALAELIEFGLQAPEGEYEALQKLRVEFGRSLEALFEDVDLLISPCMPYLPPVIDEMLSLAADPNRANGLTFTAPFDYSGHPTLSLPAGLAAGRLPRSVQLIGPRLGEPLLLRAGAAYESARGPLEHPIP